jgi:hypothetical protein
MDFENHHLTCASEPAYWTLEIIILTNELGSDLENLPDLTNEP